MKRCQNTHTHKKNKNNFVKKRVKDKRINVRQKQRTVQCNRIDAWYKACGRIRDLSEKRKITQNYKTH